MIDVASLVFDTVYNGINNVRQDVTVTKGYIEEKASMPCVVVRETGNVPVQDTNTDDCAENYSRLTYQVEVYSEKPGIARSECRELLNLVDGIMSGMKFRRTYISDAFNENRTRYRQYARFAVIVSKGVTTTTGTGDEAETTTTFHMYRR